MGRGVLEVIKPGLATSVQDLGRTGYQQYGVVVSGAMDAYALQVGNLLVGNRRGAAGLEITLMGPELGILRDTTIAVCGADLSPTVDGVPIPVWKSVQVKKGQTLTFGQPRSGVYAYLTVSGGIRVPDVMGSKSTYAKARLGGVKGRYVKKGDVLKAEDMADRVKQVGRRGIPPSNVPDYRPSKSIRVVLGPDHELFDLESIETFLSEAYRVTTQSDRMGYRLSGPKLKHTSGADIISDAIMPGTVQVPANGEPIVLMADRQTTGGYSRVATVTSVDLPYVAQLPPGSKLTFEAVSVEEAHRLWIERETLLRQLSIAAGVYER
ncbi:MAG: biotin-dependent carboxyltransferase family protein [Novibacillus thermophilus]|jgi:antagonist of KipI|uniref:KipI antagonist n=1 Tax=Novibacillus thermophilus TaxID=1471761 RepID=A0A1U9KB10_9BACL|nr:biotin-dependent carboxyltransferase family protein [Novibacillus thermophilus]AQS57259.1 KipI antagonist [Novibacillus thermophilus]